MARPSPTILTFLAKSLCASKKAVRLLFCGDQSSLTFTFGLFFFLVFSVCLFLFPILLAFNVDLVDRGR